MDICKRKEERYWRKIRYQKNEAKETVSGQGNLKQISPCDMCNGNSDTEEKDYKNIGCDFCDKWYHKKCTAVLAVSNDYKCDQC